jgi:hypothetical protein
VRLSEGIPQLFLFFPQEPSNWACWDPVSVVMVISSHMEHMFIFSIQQVTVMMGTPASIKQDCCPFCVLSYQFYSFLSISAFVTSSLSESEL